MKVQVNRKIDDENLVIKTYDITVNNKELRAIKYAMDFLNRNKIVVGNRDLINTNFIMHQTLKNLENNNEI